MGAMPPVTESDQVMRFYVGVGTFVGDGDGGCAVA
jgi:hypothetical protein